MKAMKIIVVIALLSINTSQINALSIVTIDSCLASSAVVISSKKDSIAYIKKDILNNSKHIIVYNTELNKNTAEITDVAQPNFGYNLTSLMNDRYLCWLDMSKEN
jgi:hypothetical protein